MKKVALLLDIGVATVWRWVNQGIQTNYRQAGNRKADQQVQTVLKSLLIAYPFLTLVQMRLKIQESLGIVLSRQCIARAIKLFGFSRKRSSCRGITNKETLHYRIEAFKNRFSVLNKDSIVAVDEVGFDYRTLPIYGYSQKGEKAIIRTNSRFRQRTNMIMAITNSGRFFVHIINGKVNGNIFAEFINDLSTKLGSIILLDNASIHRTFNVQDAFMGNRLRPLFIPPYSPDFNPIENVFSVIKNKVRSHLAFTPSQNPINIIKTVLKTLDTTIFSRCFQHFYKVAAIL